MTHTSRLSPPIDRATGVEELRRENSQLREALLSRATIDQAKGMLMQAYGLDAERAFAVLTRWSQARNIKVRVLAETMTRQLETTTPAVRPAALPAKPVDPGTRSAPAPSSPGWYRDPERPRLHRYWDGHAWHTAPAAHPAPHDAADAGPSSR